MNPKAWWILFLAVGVTACAGIPREQGGVSALDRYLAYAGDPVDRINYPHRLRGWHPIDREHLYIRTEPTTTYMLTVTGGCIGLMTTHRLGITTQAGRTVVTSGLDEVRVEKDRCRIVEIRPLDIDRMRAEERAD